MFVPVLRVAGRRRLPSVILNLPQYGFTLGSVLPARMSVMIPAVPGSTTCSGSGVVAGPISSVPAPSVTVMIVVW